MPARRASGRKHAERPDAEEVRRRWLALDFDRRQKAMRWEDPVLVERVRDAVQSIYQRNAMMQQLGIRLGAGGGNEDAFASSVLLRDVFEFPCTIMRSKDHPDLVLVDQTQASLMQIKVSFLERDDFITQMQAVLPDFLSPPAHSNVGVSARVQISRARWKEIWATEPASLGQLEKQLARLVEQTLWWMSSEAMFAEPDVTAEDIVMASLEYESWMADCDEETKSSRNGHPDKQKRKKKKRRQCTSESLPTAESIGDLGEAEDDPQKAELENNEAMVNPGASDVAKKEERQQNMEEKVEEVKKIEGDEEEEEEMPEGKDEKKEHKNEKENQNPEAEKVRQESPPEEMRPVGELLLDPVTTSGLPFKASSLDTPVPVAIRSPPGLPSPQAPPGLFCLDAPPGLPNPQARPGLIHPQGFDGPQALIRRRRRWGSGQLVAWATQTDIDRVEARAGEQETQDMQETQKMQEIKGMLRLAEVEIDNVTAQRYSSPGKAYVGEEDVTSAGSASGAEASWDTAPLSESDH